MFALCYASSLGGCVNQGLVLIIGFVICAFYSFTVDKGCKRWTDFNDTLPNIG